MKMPRVIMVCLTGVALLSTVGCSSKPARRNDSPGKDPKVTLTATLPPGKYAGVMDMSGCITARPEGQSETKLNIAMTMETALNVEQTAKGKTGCLSCTRIKANMMGYQADTNTPLPPEAIQAKGAPGFDFSDRNRPPDPSRLLREALGEMVGPKMVWEILPDGQPGKILRNDLDSAVKNPQMAKALQGHMNPKELAEEFGGQYPKDPVGVGAIWHVTRERPVLGTSTNMSMETEYELTALQDSPTGKIAAIKYYANLCRDLNMPIEGGTMRDVDLTFQGTMHVNVDSGLPLDNAGSLTGTLNARVQGKDAKMTMDMKMNLSARQEP
jgi:hypothetical protein